MGAGHLLGEGAALLLPAAAGASVLRVAEHTIEVVSGLNEGDEVILSDMSTWDGFDKVRLR